MNSKEIIDKVKYIFSLYYGDEYKNLIEERFSSLYDIIFYDRKEKTINSDLNMDFLKYYGISDNVEEIISKKIPFSKYVIEMGFQGMMPYIENGNLRTIIYFPRTIDLQYNYDCVLVHELLHVADEHLIVNRDDLMVSRGGFETMTLKGEKSSDRSYEYFNEIIHQTIAEDITSFAHSKNIFLFNNHEDSINSIDHYKKDINPVVNLFFNKYKDKLLTHKLEGSIELFIEYVGAKKFSRFNDWLKKYYDSYKTPEIRRQSINDSDYKLLIEEGLKIVNDI